MIRSCTCYYPSDANGIHCSSDRHGRDARDGEFDAAAFMVHGDDKIRTILSVVRTSELFVVGNRVDL